MSEAAWQLKKNIGARVQESAAKPRGHEYH